MWWVSYGSAHLAAGSTEAQVAALAELLCRLQNPAEAHALLSQLHLDDHALKLRL